ncbi:hypothetical protein HYDPIDRAFT_38135 [Hydnomerulius pinastri MD-312]|nr:hypothetical protein HYDPIDRAFT_38135 [Hydnomerulius pinastri MD-312]
MLFKPALLLAGAGLAAAQSLSGISSQCTSALTSVAGSPDATCLNPSALVSLAVSSSSSSIIPTVNSWLTGLCAAGPCSNATLQAVVTNVTTGCSAELQSLGLATTDPTALVTAVETAYPTVRQVVCLKDTSTSTLCVPELLTDIQSSTTTLSINNIVGLITQLMSGQNISIPQNVSCSSCSKAAYTLVAQGFPSLVSGDQSAVQSECGASFTDGQMPSGIEETASNTTTTTTTGGAAALSVSSLNVGAAMLVAVSSAFTIFA